jgi:hypothetical protein
MNPKAVRSRIAFAGCLLLTLGAIAQEPTPPATEAEKEAIYKEVLARRVEGVVQPLGITDTNKAARVREALLLQYRTLRLRDEFIDAQLLKAGKDPASLPDRAELRQKLSVPLHEWFNSVLALELTPAQLEAVKDGMTYNKLKVTFDAYCEIIPKLTEADKAKITELLKAAREEAVAGGSAPEKSAIFQVYKDRINEYLNANGHNVAQAFKDWEAKQATQATVGSAK